MRLNAGVGTTVTLYLPRSKNIPGLVTAKVQEKIPHGNRESILLVENEPAVRKLVTSMLENLGYQVSSAENGARALSMLKTLDPLDLLLTDVVLPGGISGRELVRRLEQQRPEVNFLLMSGYATELLLEEGDLAEGAMLLHKPFSSAQLANRVRDSLAWGEDHPEI